MKKKYEVFRMELVECDPENCILAGSKTSVPIKVQNVEVEPYQDGFSTTGGFQEISFD